MLHQRGHVIHRAAQRLDRPGGDADEMIELDVLGADQFIEHAHLERTLGTTTRENRCKTCGHGPSFPVRRIRSVL
jgi:hypothetical protein